MSMIAVSSLLLAGPANAASVFEARTSVLTNLPAAKNTLTTVLQLAIPAGRWVIQSKAVAVNFGTADLVRCRLQNGTAIIDRTATQVGRESGLPLAAQLGNQVVINTISTVTIRLRCNHTENNQTADIYLDPGASLVIQEVVP